MNSLWVLIPAAIGWCVFCAYAAWGFVAGIAWVGDRLAARRDRAAKLVLDSHIAIAKLPPGTILRDANGNAWKRGTGSWVGTGEGPAYAPEIGWNDGLKLPATVLWMRVGREASR